MSGNERIGFIGIGNMGVPMSANLARAGFEVTLFDVDAARAKAHAEEIGGKAAATLAELGKAVDVVITMLPTGQIVRSVMLEMEGGLASHLGQGALLIDMSSSDPIGTRELGEALKEKGIAFVDAPVSGAVPRAIAATLAIMVGSDDPTATERAKPVLSPMGQKIFETGPLGSGHAMKALNNYVAGAGFVASCEALIVGEKFGLDPNVMVEIMNVSTGRNFHTENTLKKEVVAGHFGSGFALALLAKDVKIAADLASGLSLDVPLAQLTSRHWLEARDAIGGENDHTKAYTVWKEQAGAGKSRAGGEGER
ncbi:NAD(P)-dependent oxidoreductase [Afifella sp. IM 167]|uniref:NAD(P)-dependent oxidoreductase n=1 Tax=Afifella sp. IM 167 TaxID=2033586 RepID=UPI001CCF829E|nr:NAD(P)-dependent oxidoreductase [Afifella sp. IM 167]MBZ8132130.1 2-hydroxy-3-oxopropionate reductase [Afifella sp. IM 167]